uniref:Uncharacterized protein n=1 Tax=viral metagenome TaxID=1070528 RepID=A0A6M3Y557_9ZZZZ
MNGMNSKRTKTRYEGLDIVRYMDGLKPIYRYEIDGACVGMIMKTEKEAFYGLDSYAKEYGY